MDATISRLLQLPRLPPRDEDDSIIWLHWYSSDPEKIYGEEPDIRDFDRTATRGGAVGETDSALNDVVASYVGQIPLVEKHDHLDAAEGPHGPVITRQSRDRWVLALMAACNSAPGHLAVLLGKDKHPAITWREQGYHVETLTGTLYNQFHFERLVWTFRNRNIVTVIARSVWDDLADTIRSTDTAHRIFRGILQEDWNSVCSRPLRRTNGSEYAVGYK